MRRIMCTGALLLAVRAVSLPAQVTPPRAALQPGQQVRVVPRVPWCPYTPCTADQLHRPLVGSLRSLDADSIALETDRGLVRVSLAVVSRVDTVGLRRPRLLKGAALGFVIGAAIGAPLGASLGSICFWGTNCETHSVQEAARVGLQAGAVGALVGLFIAAGSGGEGWLAAFKRDRGAGPAPVSVTLSPTVHLAVGPAWEPSGLGICGRLTF